MEDKSGESGNGARWRREAGQDTTANFDAVFPAPAAPVPPTVPLSYARIGTVGRVRRPAMLVCLGILGLVAAALGALVNVAIIAGSRQLWRTAAGTIAEQREAARELAPVWTGEVRGARGLGESEREAVVRAVRAAMSGRPATPPPGDVAASGRVADVAIEFRPIPLSLTPDRAAMLDRLLSEVGADAIPNGLANGSLGAVWRSADHTDGPNFGTDVIATAGGTIRLANHTAQFQKLGGGTQALIRRDRFTDYDGVVRWSSAVITARVRSAHRSFPQMTREQGATVAQLLVDHRLADGPHTSGPPASLLAAVPGTDVLAWNAADGGDARWVFPSGLAMSVPTDPSAYDMRTGERRGIVPGSVNALPVSKWTMAVVIADAYAGVGLSVALVAVSLGWLRAEPWSGRAGRWWCATKVGLALALGWASLHVVAQLTGFHERAWAGGQAFPTAEYLAVRVVIAFAIQVSLPVAAWLVLRTDRVRAYWDAGSGAAAPATGARVREGGAWGPRVAATLLWVATVAHVALVPNQSSARGVGGVLLNVCGAMTCAWLAVHAMRTGRRAGAGGTRVAGLSFVCLVAAMGGGPGWAAGPSGAEANGAPDPAVIGAMVGRWTAAPDPAAARRAMEDDARRHPAETTLALYDAIATREFRVAVPAAEMMARGRPRGVVTAPIPAALLDERMKAARPALLDMYLKAPTPDDAYALLELARLRPGLVDYSAAVIGDAITGSEADQARKLVWVATRAKPTEEEREQIRRVAREATWSQLPRVAEVGNRCSAYGGWIGMITAREILFADARAGEVAARAAAVAARAEAQAAAETARRNTAFRTTVRTALGPIVAGLESADPAARTVALDKLAALTPEVFHRAPADRVAVLTGDPDPEVARRARAVLGRMRVGGDWTPDNVPADVGLAWARASDREVRTEPGELLANVLSTVATVGLWAGGAIVVAGRVGRTRRAGRDDGRAGHPRVAGERPA